MGRVQLDNAWERLVRNSVFLSLNFYKGRAERLENKTNTEYFGCIAIRGVSLIIRNPKVQQTLVP